MVASCHLLGVCNFEGPTAGYEPPLYAQKRGAYIKHSRNYIQHYEPYLFCNQVALFRGGAAKSEAANQRREPRVQLK